MAFRRSRAASRRTSRPSLCALSENVSFDLGVEWFKISSSAEISMPTATKESFDQVLHEIIDDWYDRVSTYYVTEESLEDTPDLELELEVELKRFHGDSGHRIKFNKNKLDFTYGLRAAWENQAFMIEISVNNKVTNFDYDDFKQQLFDHYDVAGGKPITKPRDLGRPLYRDVFQLPEGLGQAFQIEKKGGKADIMRLTFKTDGQYIESLARRPGATKELIENYCVAPFRSVYARVYRSSTH